MRYDLIINSARERVKEVIDVPVNKVDDDDDAGRKYVDV